jgi:exportin-7
MAELESLCNVLYNSHNPAERAHAENTLRPFSTNVDYIAQCRAILDAATSPYAQLFATSSLTKLLTDHDSLSQQLRIDMRAYVINFLATKGTALEGFVVTAQIQLLSRVVKTGWLEADEAQRDVAAEVMKFLEQNNATHYHIGLKIFNQLVSEMNQQTPGTSLIAQRKIAVSFRHTALLNIFQISLRALQSLQNDPASEARLKESACALTLTCLSYDFVGTSLDESTEDIGTIQVPSSWRGIIEEPATMALLFDAYKASSPPVSNAALECLVRLASVRRSLFASEAERNGDLRRLIAGTSEVLRLNQGLGEHDNYHEFCRLLSRLKTNYQLSELVAVDGYQTWIQHVAEFTLTSLQSWQWASSSVYYLLTLWSRLISSVPYLKGEAPSMLDAYVPRITETFITSRIDSVTAVASGTAEEDPLDNEESLQDQLESLPHLCRFRYETTVQFLTTLIDPTIAEFNMAANMPAGSDPSALSVVEGRLTWLVYIVGAVVRGRLSCSSSEPQESLDGDLAFRVFQLIQVMDQGFHATRYGAESRQRLDLAVLNFFGNFRKVYVGEQAMHSSKVYVQLSERMGLHDHLMVMNLTVTKITQNLKCFAQVDKVVEASLNLLQDLAVGFMSGKLLLRLDAINATLANHTPDHFPFLSQYANTRNRTIFYATLARLLFMEDDAAKFAEFMAPFGALCEQLSNAARSDVNAFRSDAVKHTLIGLFRDLRGIASAANSRRTYSLLFDWMYPRHVGLLLHAMETYADDPQVSTPLLKFVAEFVLNKTQRLTFEPSSVNGILLFREVSKLVVAYGRRALAAPPVKGTEAYPRRYKGIWLASTVLMRALSGNYVNFGVFDLYGDNALKDALGVAISLSLTMPLEEIMTYRKVAKSYFALVEVLFHSHVHVVAACDNATFAHLARSLEAGLRSLDVSISSQCAAAIDNLAGFYFKAVNPVIGENPAQGAEAIAAHINQLPTLFPEMLKTLFDIVLFEDCSNQWSLSRPTLSLILVNEAHYGALKAEITASMPPSKRPLMDGYFEKLMDGVTRSLEARNRDRFTQNLTVFRHDAKAG